MTEHRPNIEQEMQIKARRERIKDAWEYLKCHHGGMFSRTEMTYDEDGEPNSLLVLKTPSSTEGYYDAEYKTLVFDATKALVRTLPQENRAGDGDQVRLYKVEPQDVRKRLAMFIFKEQTREDFIFKSMMPAIQFNVTMPIC